MTKRVVGHGRWRAIQIALALASAATATVGAQRTCDNCLLTHYWTVAPDEWKSTTPLKFPESEALDFQNRPSFGIAFSGGGTRSATATVGQLRGLRQNGWLEKVRYMTAVSGGSWATVPFTYSSKSLTELLGPEEAPEDMTRAKIEAMPSSLLLQSVVHSKLSAAGFYEGIELISRQRLGGRQAFGFQVASLLDRLFGQRGSRDQTYADVLGRIFIRPVVTDGTTKLYSWDDAAVKRIVSPVDPPALTKLAFSDFLTAAPDRPFLIVGGTMIYSHSALEYPALIPMELTPLYTGIRQQFGGRLGGIYLPPAAYDGASAEGAGEDLVRISRRSEDRRFTLPDMIAVSGAAPLLGLFRGQPVLAARAGAEFFPIFNHVTVRDGQVPPPILGLSHGDGGFTDNLGLMPLLARQVRNIILFVNSKDPFETSLQLQQLFIPLDIQEEWNGDRSKSVVFDADKWVDLRDGLRHARDAKGAVVFCGTNWKVKPNELYNIRGYNGLNICFVYNHRSESWAKQLPADTQAELATSKRFRNFPWFATFEENKPRVIQLKEPQVNLLANLAAWTVTNPESKREIERALCDALCAKK